LLNRNEVPAFPQTPLFRYSLFTVNY
jgi:hypothetical protein